MDGRLAGPGTLVSGLCGDSTGPMPETRIVGGLGMAARMALLGCGSRLRHTRESATAWLATLMRQRISART